MDIIRDRILAQYPFINKSSKLLGKQLWHKIKFTWMFAGKVERKKNPILAIHQTLEATA